MHKQLLHVCRQLLASEAHGLHRTVRRWMRKIRVRDYEWVMWSMRTHGRSIRCSRLRKQVRALVEILRERVDGGGSDSSESSSSSGSSSSSSSSDEEEFYKIDKIIGVRFASNEILYLVRWAGFGADDDTWESRDKLIEDGCKDRIANFHARIGGLPAVR